MLVSLLLAGPGVLATLTMTPILIALFYTAKFDPAVGALRWICLGMSLRVITWPLGYIVVAKGLQGLFIWIDLLCAAVQLGLAWLLVPLVGLDGAGMAFFGLYVFHGAARLSDRAPAHGLPVLAREPAHRARLRAGDRGGVRELLRAALGGRDRARRRCGAGDGRGLTSHPGQPPATRTASRASPQRGGARASAPSGWREVSAAHDPRALSYRADIDGMRAIAVLLVLSFHFEVVPDGNAGFIGVDVFFVISGFLITSILRGQLDRGALSLSGFYLNRIRRLAPALLVVLLGTLALGSVCSFPKSSRSSRSRPSSRSSTSRNVYYWRSVDYFGLTSDSTYLLHTWSLAVEEQFYLFYPLALLCVHRYLRKYFWTAVGVGAVLSFLLNVALVARKPEATFYLFPTRAWELLAGGLVLPVAASWSRARWVDRRSARSVSGSSSWPRSATARSSVSPATSRCCRWGHPSVSCSREPAGRRSRDCSAASRSPTSAGSRTRSTWCTGRSTSSPGAGGRRASRFRYASRCSSRRSRWRRSCTTSSRTRSGPAACSA